ncbi:MAG: hypothetical protein FJY85_13610 [Deltaproteobacteria bacterium]|nr:hypothetical protein [Deltaproteobacteria bacterium]
MVIKGTWFSFGSFRSPPVLPASETDEEEGPEAGILEKIALMEEGLEAVDLLFEYFLSLRSSDAWEVTELPAVRKWVKGAGV